MKAYASLWSADLMALGEAVDAVDALVDGYHMDIMDESASQICCLGWILSLRCVDGPKRHWMCTLC
jgi:pentose-5-phosphate-3-epimerase